MSEPFDADDLALMTASFEAVMADAPGPGEADQALRDLGWGRSFGRRPWSGRGDGVQRSGHHRLGGHPARTTWWPMPSACPPSPDICVLFPAHLHDNPAAPQPDDPKILIQEDPLVVNGLVSSRIDQATLLVMAIDGDDGPELAVLEAGFLHNLEVTGVDPARAYRHVSIRVGADFVRSLEADGSWEAASTAARVALAHQLIAGARWMLAEARQHALDRVQFGRPVASFQSIRHKLAESLALIEGAASVAEACLRDPDPLPAGLAKSLAGQAALTTAAHAQQVLAGMGFTAEHRFHLWLKRMLALDVLFGSADWLPTEIGRDLLIYGTVPRLIQL